MAAARGEGGGGIPEDGRGEGGGCIPEDELATTETREGPGEVERSFDFGNEDHGSERGRGSSLSMSLAAASGVGLRCQGTKSLYPFKTKSDSVQDVTAAPQSLNTVFPSVNQAVQDATHGSHAVYNRGFYSSGRPEVTAGRTGATSRASTGRLDVPRAKSTNGYSRNARTRQPLPNPEPIATMPSVDVARMATAIQVFYDEEVSVHADCGIAPGGRSTYMSPAGRYEAALAHVPYVVAADVIAEGTLAALALRQNAMQRQAANSAWALNRMF
jgi:hypothetical protein